MYRASVENRGDSKYHATTRHSAFVMDTEGGGTNPVDTLLASLCACMGHQAKDYLAERQLASEAVAVDAEAGLSDDRTRLSGIAVRIDIKGARLGAEQREELVQYALRCKIYTALKAGCDITVSLKL